MQIPPTTTLLNLVASLPAQGAAAAPTMAKAPQPPAAPTPQPTTAGGEGRPTGPLPRGSIINIIA